MEDLKTNKQLNNTVEDLPRTNDGKIDVEKIAIGKDEKNRWIVPDEILEKYYKDLPAGTTNKSLNKWVYNGGILNKATQDVQRMGAEALNAKKAQRQTNAEIIDIIYSRKAPKEVIERLGLEADATIIEAINAAQALEAMKGNSKAYEVLRDTAGEKPADKIDASITGLTAEDKEMIRNMESRLESANDNSK